ncbi:MAG: hypothetical protein IKO07_12065 [Clostridia bacterium]|nr:hypothetical protein [Clostridia bacterium]
MKIVKKTLDRIRRARPADWLRLVKKLLPHAAILMAGMLIVFFAIDRVNKPMGFMTNEFHKRLTFALSLLTIYFAVQLIALQRRAERAEYRRRLREAQEKRRAPQPAAPAAARPPQARAARPTRPGQKETVRRSL